MLLSAHPDVINMEQRERASGRASCPLNPPRHAYSRRLIDTWLTRRDRWVRKPRVCLVSPPPARIVQRCRRGTRGSRLSRLFVYDFSDTLSLLSLSPSLSLSVCVCLSVSLLWSLAKARLALKHDWWTGLQADAMNPTTKGSTFGSWRWQTCSKATPVCPEVEEGPKSHRAIPIPYPGQGWIKAHGVPLAQVKWCQGYGHVVYLAVGYREHGVHHG